MCYAILKIFRDIKIILLKFSSDQTLSWRIINKKSIATSEIHITVVTIEIRKRVNLNVLP